MEKEALKRGLDKSVDRKKMREQLSLRVIRSITDSELRQCEDYLQEVERLLKSEAVKTNKIYKNQISQANSEEAKECIAESFSEDFQKFNQIFPQNFRAATLIYILSVIEYDLQFICRSAKVFGISKELPSFRNSVCESAKDFLKKDIGLVIQDGGGSNWNKITHFIKIRNAITHSSSYIEKEDTKRYIKQKEGLELDEYGKVLLGNTILPEVIATMKAFFNEIISAWEDKIE